MDDRTRQTVVEITQSTALDALDTLFAREMRAYGFTHYAAGVLSLRASNRQFLLMRWPRAWLEIYAAEGFAQEDIVLVLAQREPRTFTWGDLKVEHPGANARILAAAATFGWVDGLVIPVHGPGQTRGIISLVSPNRVDLGTEARRDVEIIALTAYLRARELADEPSHRPAVLSARERDALAGVANGRSDAEIAALLGISRATAHTYVEQAKDKLGAATRAHAVALALMRGAL